MCEVARLVWLERGVLPSGRNAARLRLQRRAPRLCSVCRPLVPALSATVFLVFTAVRELHAVRPVQSLRDAEPGRVLVQKSLRTVEERAALRPIQYIA